MSKGKISQTDELRIRFTAWITVVVQRAKIDYIRKQNRQPKSVPLDEIAEDEFCTDHKFIKEKMKETLRWNQRTNSELQVQWPA